MTSYFSTRLKQKSTWLGILTAASSLILSGGALTPEVIVTIGTSLGLIDING